MVRMTICPSWAGDDRFRVWISSASAGSLCCRTSAANVLLPTLSACISVSPAQTHAGLLTPLHDPLHSLPLLRPLVRPIALFSRTCRSIRAVWGSILQSQRGCQYLTSAVVLGEASKAVGFVCPITVCVSECLADTCSLIGLGFSRGHTPDGKRHNQTKKFNRDRPPAAVSARGGHGDSSQTQQRQTTCRCERERGHGDSPKLSSV